MVTVEELNRYMLMGRALSSRRVVMLDYPYAKGTAFKLSSRNDELFISDSEDRMCFHSALSILSSDHGFRNRCYYVNNSVVKPIQMGLIV